MVGGIQRIEADPHLIELRLPLRRPSIELPRGQPAVDPIEVGDVQPSLQPVLGPAELIEGVALRSLLLPQAHVQGIAEELHDLGRDLDRPQRIGDLLADELLPHGRLIAAAVAAATPVVHVPTLLRSIPHHCRTAGPAGDQSGELVVLALSLRPTSAHPSPVDELPDALPGLPGDQRLVSALHDLARPVDLPLVHGVPEEVGDARLGEGLAVPADHPVVASVGLETQERPALGGEIEEQAHHRRGVRVRLDLPLAVGSGDVAIAEGRPARVATLPDLARHALLHLLREPLRHVARLTDEEGPGEEMGRVAVPVDDLAFPHEVDLEAVQAELLQGEEVDQVAGGAVDALDEQDLGGVRLPEEGDHLLEALPAGLLGALGTGVLADDVEAHAGRVVPQHLELRRNRVALVRLPVRGHPGVDHRWSTCHVAS
ncbi:MAG: hypothetical protein AAF533_04730 [Acidobacteriota bacterium]